MEINCPQCDQRLRVPHGMKNPLLRCKSCGSKFRLDTAVSTERNPLVEDNATRWQPPAPPTQSAPAEPRWTPTNSPTQSSFQPASFQPEVEYAPVIEVVEEEPYPSVERRSAQTMSEKTKSFANSSLGTIALIVVVILFRGGPRLARQFFGGQPAQAPPPVQVDHDRMEELRKMRQAIEKRMEEEKFEQQNQPEALPPN